MNKLDEMVLKWQTNLQRNLEDFRNSEEGFVEDALKIAIAVVAAGALLVLVKTGIQMASDKFTDFFKGL